MAIDWNKPIGVSASSAASAALPTKTTMNLLVRERKTPKVGKYILAALVLAALVALFAKFAVFDVFSQVGLKQTELQAAQSELAAVQRQLDGYDSVLDEYHSYTGIASDGAIDALQVMDLVGEVIQPKATVTAAGVSDGTLVVNVKDISLDNLGKLTDALRNEALVSDVSVTNAIDDNSKNVAATIQIALVDMEGEGGADA